MALGITVPQLAAAIRLTTDPSAALEEPDLGILTRHRSVAESIIEKYASRAPTSVKDEAAVELVGHLYEMPVGRRNHQNAFRQSGAMSLLAFWRNPHVSLVDLDDLDDDGTPSVHVLQVVGGLSFNATPEASELTIAPTNPGVVPFAPFADMHVLLWKPREDGPITSIVFSDDVTKTNLLSAFTQWPSPINHGHLVGDVWVSNQLLTFTVARNVEVD